MEISVCFSWALDTYTFTLNFVCLLLLIYNSQMNKEKWDLAVWVCSCDPVGHGKGALVYPKSAFTFNPFIKHGMV